MSSFNLTIAQSLKKYNIEPYKRYGQNFILDLNLCEKIVKVSQLSNNDNVLEVGPGPAGLTRAILNQSPQSLTVIEQDNRFIPLLEEIRSHHNNILKIVLADALTFEIDKIIVNEACVGDTKGGESTTGYRRVTSDIITSFKVVDYSMFDRKLTIISNLPYNVGTELLIKWLKQYYLINSITVMLQKEVVERLTAKPGTKLYGRLTVLANILCNVKKCFDVKRTAFYPAPKVDSAVVQLIPKNINLTNKVISNIEEITRCAFGQRRKQLNSSLKTLDLFSILDQLKINKNIRAENLSPEQYLELAIRMSHSKSE